MEFVKQDPDIMITDSWPAGTLTQDKLYAYNVLIAQESITDQKVYIDAHRNAIITYKANAPLEWIHEELKTLAAYHREVQEQCS